MSQLDNAVQTLQRVSPPLASALRQRPELLDGPRPEDNVSRQLQAILIGVALADIRGEIELTEATRRLSTEIDALVERQLAVAISDVSARHPIVAEIGFAVIAMGKWGALELNYYSDIDLVFVHEAVPGMDTESRAAALALASRLLAVLSSPTFDGPTLNVDADLRPEGTMGPLSRSLDGYAGYYERWSEAWELQALLKARPAAGDLDLGRRFREMCDRIIWEGLDSDALRSIRALKAQVEDGARVVDIKRSRGGIRDIEFAVQLLQLVHGRFDPDLRVTSTLDAIAALNRHGYVENDEAERLSDAYRFLRDLEHRIQLRELRQTHVLPDSEEERDALGRALGFGENPPEELTVRLAQVRESARDLHERLYFRPILDSLVGLADARLDPAAAALRLEALGYRDVMAATRAVSDLTSGLSRRSRVMHQVLPLMLDWLSQSPDPDLGLAQLRLLMANTRDHSTLITLLQNNPVAGERLCTLLGTGRLLGDLIDRIPEFIPRLADDESIDDIRDREDATERLLRLLDSRPDPEAKVGTIRRFVRRRKLRIAARDVLGGASPEATLLSLSDTADAAVAAALHMIGDDGDVPLGVVAMGRWGGRELSYGSDIDLIYVHGKAGPEHGMQLATALDETLSRPNRHGEAYELDTELRPEGRKGPLTRSIDAYRSYYEKWMEPWELLALVKARPAGGDQRLLDAYLEMLEPIVWREHVPNEVLRGIREVKARVESERIPPDEDPDFHLKLGPGGLSDVEFLVQMLQLRHGGLLPSLRVTGTFPALNALLEEGVLARSDYHALHDAYLFCTRARLRLHLQRGRASDSLPTDREAAGRLAASLGFDRTGELREHYRRYTRRARRTFESLFYD